MAIRGNDGGSWVLQEEQDYDGYEKQGLQNFLTQAGIGVADKG